MDVLKSAIYSHIPEHHRTRTALATCGLILLLFLITLLLKRLLTLQCNYQQTTLPYLQGRWFLFGIDIAIQDISDLRNNNASHRALLRHQELGSTYISVVLGRSTIHTIEPANVIAVTTENFTSYGKGDWARVIARYMGKGVLVNDSDEWHASRTMLKPLFRRNKASDIATFAPHVDRLVDYLSSGENNFIDFRRAIQMTVLDIVTDVLCGQSTISLSRVASPDAQSEKRDLLDLIDELEPYGNVAIELGPFSVPVFIWKYRRILELVTGIQGFFQKAVEDIAFDQTKCTSIQSDTIIKQMLTQGLTPEKVQGELQNLFFAAFDTTTALLTNLFDCIARDEGVKIRLRDELEAVISARDTLSDVHIGRLTYLRAAIFETLRLHSPVTSHIRKACVDTSLPDGDYGKPIFVPKGTSVIWSTYALNRQQDLWGGNDCDTFRPERWFEKESGVQRLIVPERFMPFGSGPRNCLGQQFALLLTSYIAVRILLVFGTIELKRPEMRFKEAAAVTYYNGNGTRIRFSPKGA